MNRTLTVKEKITFVFLALIVVIALWYLLFFSPTKASIVELQGDQAEGTRGIIGNLEDQKEDIDLQLATFKKWQQELGIDMNKQSDDFAKIADFNNIRALTAELNTILADATSFNMSFAQISTPEEQGKDCYRRDVTLSFVTPNYETARAILKKLNESQYGCLLQNLDISEAADSAGANAVTVNATLSFFEYAKMDPAKVADAGEQPAA